MKIDPGATAWILRTWPKVPVFHEMGRRIVTPILDRVAGGVVSKDVTVCGEILSTYDGRLRLNYNAVMPVRHALKFARPCRRCWR